MNICKTLLPNTYVILYTFLKFLLVDKIDDVLHPKFFLLITCIQAFVLSASMNSCLKLSTGPTIFTVGQINFFLEFWCKIYNYRVWTNCFFELHQEPSKQSKTLYTASFPSSFHQALYTK